MALVPLDLDKLKSLAEDRGMTISMLMELVGEKRLPPKVPAELKAKIWAILETKAHAAIFAEVKRAFPRSEIGANLMTAGGEGGGFIPGNGSGGGN